MTAEVNERPQKRFSPRGVVQIIYFVIAAIGAVGGGLVLAPLQAVAAAASVRWADIPSLLVRHGFFVAPLIAFTAWAAASAAWSPSPTALAQAVKLVSLLIFGLLFVIASGRASIRGHVRIGAVTCAGFLGVLLLVEALGGMPLNHLSQPLAEHGILERNPAKGVAILLLLLWPTIAFIADSPKLARATWQLLLVVSLFLSTQFSMQANAAAAAIGLLAYGVAYALPRLAVTATFWVLGAWLLVAPWASGPLYRLVDRYVDLPLSWQVRAQIWEYALARITEQPLMGWGLNATRTFDANGAIGALRFSLSPLHPHSASLNIWVDTGGIGAGLAALALFVGGWRLGAAASRNPVFAAAMAATAAALGVIWNVSFGAWQEWWIAAAFSAAGLLAALSSEPSFTLAPSRA